SRDRAGSRAESARGGRTPPRAPRARRTRASPAVPRHQPSGPRSGQEPGLLLPRRDATAVPAPETAVAVAGGEPVRRLPNDARHEAQQARQPPHPPEPPIDLETSSRLVANAPLVQVDHRPCLRVVGERG